MKRSILNIIALLTLLSFDAYAERYGDITISSDPVDAKSQIKGYAEVSVRTLNSSPSRNHTVTVEIRGAQRYGDYIDSVRRTFVIGPASSMRTSLFLPQMNTYFNEMKIFVDNRSVGSLSFSLNQKYGYYSSSSEPEILCSRSFNSETIETNYNGVIEPLSTSSSSSGRHSHGSGSSSVTDNKRLSFVRSNFDPAEWSANWLAYTPFSGVIMSGKDWDAVKPDVKEALTRYAECGGTLIVFGPINVNPPQPWISRTSAPLDNNGFKTYNAGFGYIISADDLSPETLNNEQAQYILGKTRYNSTHWVNDPDSAWEANKRFAIVDSLRLPVRSLFIIMLAFAVLVGPYATFYLNRRKRPIWILWVLPTVSLIVTIIIVVYSFLSEGIKATTRMQSVTLLDQTTHRATSLALMGVYSPMTPGSGLRYDMETEVTSSREENYSSGTAKSIDLTEDQFLRSGWVNARVPFHAAIRKSQTRRERLDITRNPDGTIKVLNGLGEDIINLTLMDANGNVYKAKNLDAGKQTTLTKSAGPVAPAKTFDSIFTSDWVSIPEICNNPKINYLKPNMYLAELKDSPFVEKGLKKPGKLTSTAFVFGWY